MGLRLRVWEGVRGKGCGKGIGVWVGKVIWKLDMRLWMVCGVILGCVRLVRLLGVGIREGEVKWWLKELNEVLKELLKLIKW